MAAAAKGPDLVISASGRNGKYGVGSRLSALRMHQGTSGQH